MNNEDTFQKLENKGTWALLYCMLIYQSRVYTLKVKTGSNNDEKEGYVKRMCVTNR